MSDEKYKIGVIGLGYVGLPLTIEFARFFNTYGYDLSVKRVNELNQKFDRYGLVKKKNFKTKYNIKFSSTSDILQYSNFIIVTVPTPVTASNKPDLSYLKKACLEIGKYIKKNSIVVFESTVYPGATREICIPIIEKISKFKLGKDFFVGYSPERISVGDNKYHLKNIVKIISGDSIKSREIIKKVYSKILDKKLYKAESIEVAEFAKVFENTQRDLNISLVNELSIISNKLGINSKSVINAASTKWNFMKFTPGLVGGHCISVDPYYLAYKSKKVGYQTRVINAGRHVNNAMPYFIYDNIKNRIIKNKKKFKKLKVIVLGLTFKENCKDIRNSKIFDLIKIFDKKKCEVFLHDPYAIKEEVKEIYNKEIINFNKLPRSDVIILSLNHKFYLSIGLKKIISKLKKKGIFADLKSTFKSSSINLKNKQYFCL
jgi:UDP-N-acetyl-D-galactosamine dehydrogenase